MITNAYNYLNFPPWPAQILFREIAKEVMITNAYNYVNFPPWPAQILLNLGKLQKRWWLQMLSNT